MIRRPKQVKDYLVALDSSGLVDTSLDHDVIRHVHSSFT